MAFNPVKNHKIHDTLKRLLELQKSVILSSADNAIDETHNWYLNKIFYLAEAASKGIKRRLSYTTSLNALNNLDSSAESIIVELNAFINNRNPTHIFNAFNLAEQGFQIYLNQAIQHSSGKDSKDAELFIDSLNKSFDASIAALKSEKDKLSESLAELTASVSANASSVATLETQIERNQSDSDRALSEISKSYESLEVALEAKFAEGLNKWSSENASALKNIDEGTSQLVSNISKKEQEARALIQSVGDILTTGTYQKRASDEYKLSNLFRWITVGLFFIGILVVVSNFAIHFKYWWHGDQYVESTSVVLTRLLTALVVALPALYTARESARHRTNGDIATQRELELKTLGPFIELMPEEVKNAIRDRLTDRYFGNPIEPHNVLSPLDPQSLSSFLEAAARTVKKT